MSSSDYYLPLPFNERLEAIKEMNLSLGLEEALINWERQLFTTLTSHHYRSIKYGGINCGVEMSYPTYEVIEKPNGLFLVLKNEGGKRSYVAEYDDIEDANDLIAILKHKDENQ